MIVYFCHANFRTNIRNFLITYIVWNYLLIVKSDNEVIAGAVPILVNKLFGTRSNNVENRINRIE